MSSTEINYSTSPSASATSPSPPVAGPKVKGKSRTSKAEAPLTLCGDADDLLDWSWQLPDDDEEEQHNAAMVEVDNSLLALYDAVYGPLPNASIDEGYDDAAAPSQFASYSSDGASSISRLRLASSEDKSNVNESSDTDEESFNSTEESSDDDYDPWDFFNQEPIPLLRRTVLDIVEDCAGQLLPAPEISNPRLTEIDDANEEIRHYEESFEHEDDEVNDEDEGDTTASSAGASPASPCGTLPEEEELLADETEESPEEGDTPLLTAGESIGDSPGTLTPKALGDDANSGPPSDEVTFVRRSLRKRKFVEIQEWDEEDDEDLEDVESAEEEEKKKPLRKSRRTKKVGPADKLSAAFMRHYFDMDYVHSRDKTWDCPCPISMHLEHGVCENQYNADGLFSHLNTHGKVYAARHSGAAPPCTSEGCKWSGEPASFGRHVHDIHVEAKTVRCPCGGRVCRDDHGQVKRHLRSRSHAEDLKKKGLTKYRDVDDPHLLSVEARWRQDTEVEKTKRQRPRKNARLN